MVLIYPLLLTAFFAGTHSQATIGQTIVNNSAIIGGDTFFYCEVTGTQTGIGDTLVFSHEGSILSSDSTVSNTTKYSVTGKYNLTVKSTVWSDEGEYTCTFGTTPFNGYLTLSDPPTSSSIYWGIEKNSWTEKDKTNDLTCECSSSRPPATFRWYRGNKELTTALYHMGAIDDNGYAMAQSRLSLTPKSSDEGVVYTCYVDIPGGEAYFTHSLPVSLSGTANEVSSLLFIFMTVVISITM